MLALKTLAGKILAGHVSFAELGRPFDLILNRITACSDQMNRPLALTEASLRAVLFRIDPNEAQQVDKSTIRVSAWAIAHAIDSKSDPVYEPIPNRILGARRWDRRALRRLRDRCLYEVACGTRATILLNVPETVAGWIGIRFRKSFIPT